MTTIDDFGRVSEWEDLREKNRPPIPIKLVLVGESPPNSNTGRFFYDRGPLTQHTKKAFQAVYPEIGELNESQFLACFKTLGCYLDDISLKPVDGMTNFERNYTILTELNQFIMRLKVYRPKAIVTVIKRIDFFVRYAVEEACLNYNPVFLPFPARNQTNVENYVLGLARVLSEEIEKSNLPKECSENLPLEI